MKLKFGDLKTRDILILQSKLKHVEGKIEEYIERKKSSPEPSFWNKCIRVYEVKKNSLEEQIRNIREMKKYKGINYNKEGDLTNKI